MVITAIHLTLRCYIEAFNSHMILISTAHRKVYQYHFHDDLKFNNQHTKGNSWKVGSHDFRYHMGFMSFNSLLLFNNWSWSYGFRGNRKVK